jgi:hypothetical protein
VFKGWVEGKKREGNTSKMIVKIRRYKDMGKGYRE